MATLEMDVRKTALIAERAPDIRWSDEMPNYELRNAVAALD